MMGYEAPSMAAMAAYIAGMASHLEPAGLLQSVRKEGLFPPYTPKYTHPRPYGGYGGLHRGHLLAPTARSSPLC